MNDYSFCEKVSAGPFSKWHIRILTEKGQCLNGGADTLSLCGEKVAWDLSVKMTEFHLTNNTCSKCLEFYKNELKT